MKSESDCSYKYVHLWSSCVDIHGGGAIISQNNRFKKFLHYKVILYLNLCMHACVHAFVEFYGNEVS